MKVVHIESGLGNQMLDYCEFLAVKHAQPEEKCYIETITFEIPECSAVFSQWNGYELERVFGIKAPNIRECFTPLQWSGILGSVRESRFWENQWNWPESFCKAFAEEGLPLANLRKDLKITMSSNRSLRFKQTALYCIVREIYKRHNTSKYIQDYTRALYYTGKEDALMGHRLKFKMRGNNIEAIDEDIRAAFRFPPIVDARNREIADRIVHSESVAIHVRRGDMLPWNEGYYKRGYFRKAVKYIKRNVQSPVFYFFCNAKDMEYCRRELGAFALDQNDRICFVDWNAGENSYIDIQLMSMCKHNVVTNSTFGWWGAYLNQNPNKITISPEIEMNTTHHF